MNFKVVMSAAAAFAMGGAAAAAPLTPHVAYYEMTLDSARGQAGVVDVRGALAFDWSIACDAYVVEQQAALQFFYDGGAVESVGWTFETTEAFDQSRYDFEMRRTRGGGVEEVIEGEAAVADAGGVAAFAAPDDAEPANLPAGAMFPSHHTKELIELAESGGKLLSARVFVGDSAEGATLLSAVVGKPIAAPEDGPEMTRRPAWPVRIAFFAPDAPPDAGPEHEQDLVLQDDGIVRSLLLDYGEFVVRAELKKIEPGKREDC